MFLTNRKKRGGDPDKIHSQGVCASGVVLLLGIIAGSGQAQSAPLKSDLPDLSGISRLREEGLEHSQVMRTAERLTDEVGPRLTGSPGFERGAQWAVEQLRASGIANAREESWGPFGMGWTQQKVGLWQDLPYPATLIAQATPWSPPTSGVVSGGTVLIPEITDIQQLAQYRGQLRGKVVLYGVSPLANPNPGPPLIPVDDAYLKARTTYPLNSVRSIAQKDLEASAQRKLTTSVANFFAEEGVLAVLCSSSGEGAMFHDEEGFSWLAFQKDHRQTVPSLAVAPDDYGRLSRLAIRNIATKLTLNVDTNFQPGPVDGKNVVGEIEGSDPLLKQQLVMLGAHLDSWAAGEGATDDGAGVAVGIEAMRILKAAGVRPRRTIRLALWGGEEQGELGSLAYVKQHFAKETRASAPPWNVLPEWERPLLNSEPLPEDRDFDVYLNLDAGGGKILGIYTEDNVAAAEVFRGWLASLADLGMSSVSLQHKTGVDSNRFEEVGLPGFHLMQDLRDYDSRTHHTNLDNYERLSEADLKQAATVMAILAFDAAESDDLIPRRSRLIPGQPPSTSLK